MRHARGFSIVELLIAMVLGSIVIIGIVQLFVANSATYKVLVGQSRMQESARFSLEFIGRDVRRAGYRGCLSSKGEIRVNVAPSDLPYEYDIRLPVAGYNGGGTGWSPALTPINGIDVSLIVSGTDVLTTRNLSAVESRLKNDLTTTQIKPTIRIDAGWAEFFKGDIVMIHDCEKATLFHVMNMTPDLTAPSASAQDLVIDHGFGGAISNTTLQLADVNTFETDAAISAVEASTYFIAPGTGVNSAGDTPSSLWRKTGAATPVELVEGVEDLQLLFGVDRVDGDGVPDQYLQANQVDDWGELVTIRVSIVANSVDALDGITGDGLMRRTFSQTYFIRNHG